MTHDMNQDEIRRQLRAVDRMNDEAMPKWRALLDRIVGGDPIDQHRREGGRARRAVDHPAHAVQVRRGHDHRRRRARRLRLGQGHQGDHDRRARARPAVRPPRWRRARRWGRRRRWPRPAAPRAPAAMSGAEQDLVLARTAASLEKLAVEVYGTAAGLLTTPAIKDAATMFAGHHQQHLDALNGVITKAGGTAVTEQNQAVYDALIAPGARRGEDRGRRGEARRDAGGGGGADLCVRRRGAVDPGAALDDHDDRRRRGPPRRGAAHGRHWPRRRATSSRAAAFFPGDNPLAGIDGR